MQDLINELGIDETFQKKPKRPKKAYSNFADNVPAIEDYNFMADTLHMPKDKNGYGFLLVVIDLATHEFDIEPMKSAVDKKTKKDAITSQDALLAMNTMFKRKHINKPYASLSSDGGPEFKSVFAKYLYKNSILHRVGEIGRHQQHAPVESLNRQLGRLFNGYMNKMEIKTGKPYREWTDIIDIVRTKLNALRKNPVTAKSMIDITYKVPNISHKPKFKVGTLVYRVLNHVESALGNKQPSEKYREGDYRYDRQPRKIEQIFVYTGDQLYRYQLKGLPNVSYAEWELMPATEEDELFEVRKFLKSRKKGNKVELLTWYWKELKKDASWQPRSEMIKFVPDMVNKFEEQL